ncbi:hypothetical protein CC80DRAFT_590563 [Byssothecium circinans]|uniref:Uncharacterized protein n=1 Tax=Byssothecium circinans TaxID=147558 RepID=A0A6A5U6I3_9PLEO|nr:hypothetical protein CC80DRAFT_590563 [Byssothecium circinans]
MSTFSLPPPMQIRASDEQLDEFPDISAYQSIPGKTIDSRKLSSFLRTKFGAGAYDVHIMQDSYCILAPRKLSLDEIARCRRR